MNDIISDTRQPQRDVDSDDVSAGADVERTVSLKVWLLVATIILTGVAFRAMLLNTFDLDFDESMHFQVAREPTLAKAWEASRIHTHPPLIFLFYHMWLPLGDSEAMLRLPS